MDRKGASAFAPSCTRIFSDIHYSYFSSPSPPFRLFLSVISFQFVAKSVSLLVLVDSLDIYQDPATLGDITRSEDEASLLVYGWMEGCVNLWEKRKRARKERGSPGSLLVNTNNRNI